MKNNLNDILKPKSEEDIIRDLNKLSYEEKNKALIRASEKGYLEATNILLKFGVDVNIKDKYGDTALMYASAYGYVNIIKLLIEAGADINTKNIYENTPLIYAYRNGQLEVVKLLIEAGQMLMLKTNIEKMH